MEGLFTTGQIAGKLDERIARVEYAIRWLKLKPVDRVGIIRLFNELQVSAIKEKLYNLRIQK